MWLLGCTGEHGSWFTVLQVYEDSMWISWVPQITYASNYEGESGFSSLRRYRCRMSSKLYQRADIQGADTCEELEESSRTAEYCDVDSWHSMFALFTQERCAPSLLWTRVELEETHPFYLCLEHRPYPSQSPLPELPIPCCMWLDADNARHGVVPRMQASPQRRDGADGEPTRAPQRS